MSLFERLKSFHSVIIDRGHETLYVLFIYIRIINEIIED